MSRSGLKYAYFGTGVFAARCLELLSEWTEPSWVVTPPPRRSGRGGAVTRTPVGRLVSSKGWDIPLVETDAASADPAVLDCLESVPVDLAFAVDFGQFIKGPLLYIGAGCLNIHPSMLPLYRGAAPLQRALMDGAKETGVTVFRLDSGMDSGPVLLQKSIEIGGEDDFGSLREQSAVSGVRAFTEFARVSPIEEWNFTPQDGSSATSAPKVSSGEERIDWRRPAFEIVNLVRALSPRPGAWTTMRGKRLLILSARAAEGASGMSAGGLCFDGGVRVSAGEGSVALVTVQPEGKKPLPAEAWKNGLRMSAEECMI
ncbi:MAG: methionyl-tRNA formyltransferase [Synergistaceae bacterium]|jgi:methionyl-tRNA formyltransferase|nr:methionyl-tRNA formyltransferase [Synergistaceae bacterium]